MEAVKKLLKNKHNILLILILIIGIGLMLLPSSGKQQSDTAVKPESVRQGEEERLEKILSEMKGTGDVSVMITYYSTGEKNIAYETNESTNQDNSEKDSRTQESIDKKAVLANGEPMVIREEYPVVKGVIVTASGAEDPGVKRAIVDSVSAVLDVPAHKICVYAKE